MRTVAIIALAGILAGCHPIPTAPSAATAPTWPDPTFAPGRSGSGVVCFRAPCPPLPTE